MENGLPPGFRFYPTEEELLGFYLHNKLESVREEDMQVVIPVVDVYDFDPWHLPAVAGNICRQDGQEEYFFFCPRQEREAHGGRPTRTTPSGYWKATGSPCRVFSSTNRVMGVKKTMVFYRGKAPNGHKTKWKMNEYRCFEDDDHATTSTAILTHDNARLRGEYSVCRVYTKSGCIRSFDRRPGLETTNLEPQRPPSPIRPPPPIVNTDTAPTAPVSRRRSHESNSSDGDGGLSSSARFVRQRAEDTEEWDLLEWFSTN